MKRNVPFSFSVLLVLLLSCAQGCALLMVRGYEVMKERNDIKERVDVSWSTQANVRDVWAATLASADRLKLTIQSKDFDGTGGTIKASTPVADYIRIHISEDPKHTTMIGVQARRKEVPSNFGDYDFALAEKIITDIRKNLEQMPKSSF